jgi:tetratricopeptide (TPR) repeat protein
MRATIYSRPEGVPSRWLAALFCGFCVTAAGGVRAADQPFKQLIENLYHTTKERHQQSPVDDEAAWRYSRACFEWAEFSRSDASRAALAEEGIAVARKLIVRKPDSAFGHYYLGMNLGQLARTRTLTALGIVSDMEQAFEKARQLDASTDYAGPDRYLGMLYRDAPGWPASIGNRRKARVHLERAAALRPDYPENQLALLESYREWNEKDAFLKHFGPAALALAEARKKLTGPYWEGRWAGWDKDWHELRAYKNTLEPERRLFRRD